MSAGASVPIIVVDVLVCAEPVDQALAYGPHPQITSLAEPKTPAAPIALGTGRRSTQLGRGGAAARQLENGGASESATDLSHTCVVTPPAAPYTCPPTRLPC